MALTFVSIMYFYGLMRSVAQLELRFRGGSGGGGGHVLFSYMADELGY